MPTTKEHRQLALLCDPVGLCQHIGEALDYNSDKCDTSFRYTREFFAEYSPDVPIDDALTLLRQMGASCDCEVGFNICPEVE